MQPEQIIQIAADSLFGIPGIAAVVLGGSRATGEASEESDIDIGVYYDSSFCTASFRQAVQKLDPKATAAEPGEWGPWINGGAWLTIGGIPTDFLLRDLSKVTTVLDNCIRGCITIDYQCGHPFGFVNAIYAAEIACCKILWEKSGAVSALKDRIFPYPEQMRRAMIDKFLWEAEFSIRCGSKSVGKGDFINVSGSIYRAAVSLLYAIAARNERFILNEKGIFSQVSRCEIKPKNLLPLCEAAFADLRPDSASLRRSVDAVRRLLDEVRGLTRT
jgi:hypothetical protein